MKEKVQVALSLIVALVAILFSPSAQAVTDFEEQMCADEVHERCVSNAYNRFLEVHRDYSRWEHDLAACKFRFNRWQAKWQDYLNGWHRKCDGQQLRLDCRKPKSAARADHAAQLGCENTLDRMRTAKADALEARFERERRLAADEAEARRRREAITQLAVLGPDDVPRRPKRDGDVAKKPAEPVTTADLAELESLEAQDKTVARRSQPLPTPAPKAQPASEPKNAPSSVAAIPEGIAKAGIKCIPEHVSVVKIADNGDLELFIGAGADIYQLNRCLPKHDFDPKRVVSTNIAAATIPYYLEFADKPLYRNKLHFHKGRGRIKRSMWFLPGKEYYEAFFEDHEGKQFGFALQGGQKLKLALSEQPAAPSNDGGSSAEAGPNEPANHGTDTMLDSGEKQYRYASSLPATLHLKTDLNKALSTSVREPRRQRERAPLMLASVVASQRGSSLQSENTPTGRAYIRAGPRVSRAMHIREERYRRNGGADCNSKIRTVSRDARVSLSHCRHYGPYAFG